MLSIAAGPKNTKIYLIITGPDDHIINTEKPYIRIVTMKKMRSDTQCLLNTRSQKVQNTHLNLDYWQNVIVYVYALDILGMCLTLSIFAWLVRIGFSIVDKANGPR